MFAAVLLLRPQVNRKVQVSDKRRVTQETAETITLTDLVKEHGIAVDLSDTIQKLAHCFLG